MASIDSFRKQAKLLVRWHRERDFAVGAKVRLLERFSHLSDAQILDMPMPLTLAQEIAAVEAGFADWNALRSGIATVSAPSLNRSADLRLMNITPILFVKDVVAAASFYETKLGFKTDFIHGQPPFYGSVSRDNICLHLRLVHRPNFAALAGRERSLILATIEVSNVKALFDEMSSNGVEFAQPLCRHAWGGIDFYVRDPDGNVISFAQYLPPPEITGT